MARHSSRRIPKLAFTKTRGIGWHVNYRDPLSRVPRKHRFGMVEREKAFELYNAWLAEHLQGAPHRSKSETDKPATKKDPSAKAARRVRLKARMITRESCGTYAKKNVESVPFSGAYSGLLANVSTSTSYDPQAENS